MDGDVPPFCDVCAEFPATAGGLCCGHEFCPECFARYIAGSIRELDVSARCCVCGQISNLIEEISEDHATVLTYGRRGETKLLFPVGITRHQNGDCVTVDKGMKRVYIHDERGRLRHDFAYTYSTEPTGGVTVTPRGILAIPCKGVDHAYVSYFTVDGSLVGTSYVTSPGGAPNIKAAACDTESNLLYLTDYDNSCIHVLNNNTKQQCALIKLKPIQFETTPKPTGITVKNNGDVIFTDTANNCVKIYSKEGDFLQKIGSRGNRPVQFEHPTDVKVTSQGELVVVDRGNQRVQLLNANGEFIRYIVRYKSGYDIYMAPMSIALSQKDDVILLMTSLQTAAVGEVRVYKR